MRRKICVGIMVLSFIPLLSGCLALLAGAGGTALWQAGKIISEEMVSLDQGVAAVESAFKDQKIAVTEKVAKTKAVQVRGDDADGTRVAVDVISEGPSQVRIEIRYGLGQEDPARALLNQIKRRL